MKGINYLCKEYIGLDEKQIRMIKRMKTRWCCCFRNYPMVCMTERSIWLLNSMGGDNNNSADDSAESDSDWGDEGKYQYMKSGETVVTKRTVWTIWCRWRPFLLLTKLVYVYKNKEENVSFKEKKGLQSSKIVFGDLQLRREIVQECTNSERNCKVFSR